MPESLSLYPAHNALYYSYYLWALAQRVCWEKMKYTGEDFPNLHHHCLAFTFNDDLPSKKIYISAGDGIGFNSAGLHRCDVYAKVNIDPQNLPQQYRHKVIPIGPSFGIRYLPFPQFFIRSIETFYLSRVRIENPREHFANYYRQWRYRLPLDAFIPGESSSDYIFSVASLWTKEHEINHLRSLFMHACHSLPGIDFEGGFPNNKGKSIPGYEDFTIDRRYSLGEYIQKIQRSAVVFNTPAVRGCLGWKLGEFLALGKAIISTPITRLLPAPLLHGEHVHYIDQPSLQTIRAAVERISTDCAYRTKLEQGSHNYFMTYLHPERILERLLDKFRR